MEPSNNILRDESLRTEEVECTFSPEINKIRKLTKQFSDYLSINAYARLSHGRNGDKVRAYETMEEQKTSDPVIVKKKLNDFYARQLEFEQKKLVKKEALFNATQIKPRPSINKKSKEIVKGLSKQKNKINSTHTLHDKKENKGNFTFRPEILPESRNRPCKTLDEMIYMPIFLKEQKLNRIRENIKQQENESLTAPTKSIEGKYAKVQSKLKILDCIDTLMDRIKRDKFNNKNFKKKTKT
jgi:hypothetical protein